MNKTKKQLVEENAVLFAALKDANEICRSAYSVAARRGVETNWEPFKEKIEKSLLLQHQIIYPK